MSRINKTKSVTGLHRRIGHATGPSLGPGPQPFGRCCRLATSMSRSEAKTKNGEVVSDEVDGNVRALVDPTVIAVTVTTAVSWSLPATGLLSFSRVPGA